MSMLPYSQLEIQHLTWRDVRERLDTGYKTVVFSVGAIEQHGPHLPIVVDALLGTAIARLVAAELGNALVAPTIRPGYSPHHMGFPGTITLRQTTLIALIVDYCTSLVEHGFDTMVVISAHGGNTTSVKMGAEEAQTLVGDRALVIPITNLAGYSDSGSDRHQEGYHATKMETSCVLSLAPELVHMERANDWTNPISEHIKDIGALLRLGGTQRFAPDGTMGKPSTANPKLGEEALRQKARNVADQVRLMLDHLK